MLAKLSVVTIITPESSRRPAAATEDRHVGAQDTRSLCTQKRTNLVVAILTNRLLILGERSTSEAWPMSANYRTSSGVAEVSNTKFTSRLSKLGGWGTWTRTKTGGVKVL